MIYIRILSLIFVLLLLSNKSIAQVWPYQIPPKWMFGYKAGFDFGTSPFTNSPPNILSGNPTNNSGAGPDAVPAMETSSAICDPLSNLVLYTNFFRFYDYPGNTSYAFPTNPSGAGSSVTGGVIVPDPASPSSSYYIFVANDLTAGTGPGYSKGVNYYKVNIPVSAANTTGPVNLAVTSETDEAMCAGTDGNGGYWIVAHGRSYSNGASFLVWHVTSTGVTALSPQLAPNPGAPFPAPANNGNLGIPGASMKISRCQDRIAYFVGSYVEVYSWDRNTGKIGSVLYRQSGIAFGSSFGVEFSPNGEYVYFSTLNGGLSRIEVASKTGAPITLSNGSSNPSCSEMGTMQLGPDGKIYVTNCGNLTQQAVYVGVVNKPDLAACDYQGQGLLLKPANSSYYPTISRGIANMAWMSPNAPKIILSNGGSCSKVMHTIEFNTYFNTPIDILASPTSSIQWSFDNGLTWVDGNGTSSIIHDYGGSMSTTAIVKFKDKTCANYEWTASVSVTTTCNPVVCDAPVAKAGTDLYICNESETNVNANNAGTGIGSWKVMEGSANIVSVNDNSSDVIGLPANGKTVLRWTVSKSGCSDTYDDVEIYTYSKPVADAGEDVIVCEGEEVQLKAVLPGIGEGRWSFADSYHGTIEQINDPHSKVRDLLFGKSILKWTVTNGVCDPVVDEVNVVVNPKAPSANVIGGDATICTRSFDLKGILPEGYSGEWNVIEGTGLLEDSKNAQTKVLNLSDGLNTFQWTITGTCGSNTAVKNIYVGPSSYELIATLSDDTLCVGTDAEVILKINGSPVLPLKYTWIFYGTEEMTMELNNSNVIIPSTKAGWLYYTIDVVDSVSCHLKNIVRDSIFSIDKQELVVPNLITPNFDKKNDCLIVIDKTGVPVFPGSEFVLFNRWGAQVYKTHDLINGEFCPESLEDGVYFYTIEPSCGSPTKGWLQILSSGN